VSSAAADIFLQAAQLNADDPRRGGNTVHLEGDGLNVVVAGDIHGCRDALAKVIDYAALGRDDGRRLVLQEIIHGTIDPRTGHDRSVELLLRAARLKVSMGPKVVFIMGNHDLAQITGNEILKQGRGVCKSFIQGLQYCFGDEAPEIIDSVDAFLRSMPLAIRCANGVMITHSLPDHNRMDLAGVEILQRGYQPGDLTRGGPAYEWTWGRNQSDEQIDRLAEDLGVEFFILGHRKIPAGWQRVSDRAIAIASDHDKGCVCRFTGREHLTIDTIRQHIQPLSTIRRRR